MPGFHTEEIQAHDEYSGWHPKDQQLPVAFSGGIGDLAWA
jgi:hypothetical protein